MYYCRLSIEKYEKRTNIDAILANQEMRIGFVKYVINYFYINIVNSKTHMVVRNSTFYQQLIRF